MERQKWYSNWVLYPLTICVYFAATTTLYAKSAAAHIRAGEGKAVVVELTTDPASTKHHERASAQLLLGANSKFLFLYTLEKETVQVIPIAGISRITMEPTAKGVPVREEFGNLPSTAISKTAHPQRGDKGR